MSKNKYYILDVWFSEKHGKRFRCSEYLELASGTVSLIDHDPGNKLHLDIRDYWTKEVTEVQIEGDYVELRKQYDEFCGEYGEYENTEHEQYKSGFYWPSFEAFHTDTARWQNEYADIKSGKKK